MALWRDWRSAGQGRGPTPFDVERWRATAERNLIPSLAVVAVLGTLVGLYSLYGGGSGERSVAAAPPAPTSVPPASSQAAHTLSGIRAIYEAPGLAGPPPPANFATLAAPWDLPGTATPSTDPTRSAIDALTFTLTHSPGPAGAASVRVPIGVPIEVPVTPTPSGTAVSPVSDPPPDPSSVPPSDSATDPPPDSTPPSSPEPPSDTPTDTATVTPSDPPIESPSITPTP